jgi:hypothetical protein
MGSNYFGSDSTPVSTSRLWRKFSVSRISGNRHTGIGECQISGQSNPTLPLPSTKGNRTRILLPNWLSNSHTATIINFNESPPNMPTLIEGKDRGQHARGARIDASIHNLKQRGGGFIKSKHWSAPADTVLITRAPYLYLRRTACARYFTFKPIKP